MTKMHRRRFLHVAGGGVAGAVFLSSSAFTGRAQDFYKPLFGEPGAGIGTAHSWRGVRKKFPLRDDITMLNAANLTPTPSKIIARQNKLALEIEEDPSFSNRDRFNDLYKTSIESLAELVNADVNEIAITRNASESNNIVVHGLDLCAGDEVIVWSHNHPSNNLAWDVLAKQRGFTVTKITTPHVFVDESELIAPFVNAINVNTKVLAVTHVCNDTGVRLPIKALTAVARAHNIFSLVDGAQSLGALAIDVKDLGVDAFTASLHKWLCGPKETGMLYLGKHVQAQLAPSIVTVDFEEGPYDCAGRFSALGQRNDAAIAVVADAVNFHSWLTSSAVEKRVLELASYFKQALRTKFVDVDFITPLASELSAGIIFFQIPGLNFDTAHYDIYRRFGIAMDSWANDDPYPGLRVCPHVYNSHEDLDYVVWALGKMRAA